MTDNFCYNNNNNINHNLISDTTQNYYSVYVLLIMEYVMIMMLFCYNIDVRKNNKAI